MFGLLESRVMSRTIACSGRASRRGGHPGFFFSKPCGQLAAAGDLELGVRAGQVAFDGLQRHVELASDLAVRAPARSEPRDAQLARREREDAAAPLAARPRAERV